MVVDPTAYGGPGTVVGGIEVDVDVVVGGGGAAEVDVALELRAVDDAHPLAHRRATARRAAFRMSPKPYTSPNVSRQHRMFGRCRSL